VGMVGIAERVYDVVTECVNAEGAIRNYLDLWRVLWRSMATVMAADSALLTVCLSGCNLISTWVVVFVCGLTIDALNVGFPVFLSVCVY